jgi:hypothetical protein
LAEDVASWGRGGMLEKPPDLAKLFYVSFLQMQELFNFKQ